MTPGRPTSPPADWFFVRRFGRRARVGTPRTFGGTRCPTCNGGRRLTAGRLVCDVCEGPDGR